MLNSEKMLSLVLSDQRLKDTYGYDSSDYEDLPSALASDNPVVVAVARIIKNLNGSSDQATVSSVYKDVFNYLNTNLLK